MQNKLKEAIEQNELNKVKKYLQEYNFSKDELFNALSKACDPMFSDINLEMVELLLTNNADPNLLYKDDEDEDEDNGESLLYHIFWFQKDHGEDYLYKICEMLLKHGANPNVSAEDGSGNAFYLACNYLWEDIIRLMLKHGALPDNPAAIDPDETALYEVFTRQDDHQAMARVTKSLLDAGANPDYPCGSWQRTPLMMAAESGAYDAVKLMLETGADAGHKDRDGISILDQVTESGHARIVELLADFGCEVSPSRKLVSQLRASFKNEDFDQVAEIGEQLLEIESPDVDDLYMISVAMSSTGQHDKAIELAKNFADFENNESMISRYIQAMIHGVRFGPAIENWNHYKSRIPLDSFDPFLIANLLYAYDKENRQAEGLIELEPWFSNTDVSTEDEGLMKFNAACLYSLTGDLENALHMASLALEEGKDRESFYAEDELENLRNSPVFALLMDENGVISTALEHPDNKRYCELVILYHDVIVREYKHKGDLASGNPAEFEHERRSDTILDYQTRLEQLTALGYSECRPFSIEYWTKVFIQDFKDIQLSQSNGDLPVLGAYVVEWDFGDDACDRSIWIGLYSYDTPENADEIFSSYVYGDDVISDDSYNGPPIDTAELFETIVKEVSLSSAFRSIQKLSPFYFVYQEHDSGHIHMVKV